MNKRGQFFFFAALITIGVVIGLSQAFNYASGKENQAAFYDLSKEINFETKKVLDYGVYNEVDTENLMDRFLENYSDYIAQEKVLFIYGNKDKLNAKYFQLEGIGSAGILGGGSTVSVLIQQSTQQAANVNLQGDNVNVEIDDITYGFKLLKGQNFFFVIIKEEGAEKFVAVK
jgi:hypothetical protein